MGFLVVLSFLVTANANENSIPWDKAPNKTNDIVALQHGAKLFVNYCQNCHAASYMRFNRLEDIGLSEQQIRDNFLFSTNKIGDTMGVSMDPKNAKDWFGVVPPDLTLVARSRSGSNGSGADYLYTYLRTYYRDETKATGWNNLAYPNTAMPHVLWEMQGERKPVYSEVEQHGRKVQMLKSWEQVTPGTLTSLEYDHAIGDLVAYMQWMSEPTQNSRVRIGIMVLFFLMLLTFTTWRLNASFWKNVK